ncbi:bifunctional 3'-5' exonuclease/DNA polymerase [Cryobacterium sp. SO2]|uniref:bifunctional 3'-5' exonuclease/DNA polymerase n=1 Tax=Cryobacterium sp. SO2 TaxID=1897060 RepID=UPI00223C8C7A|nr:bifunctional 3'-5' exonuclease/DNA polymerase [Cryobacterium sp. SO2]WEO79118.1 bifunctional 3'-5' exonuclease/DNA polymerase [Cryobacterium sp. SO2]
MYILVTRTGSERFRVRALDEHGAPDGSEQTLSVEGFRAFAADSEHLLPRWVWEDTARIYPVLLAGGLRVRRAHDLRLCHAILRLSEATAGSPLANAPAGRWDLRAPSAAPQSAVAPGGATLFDLDDGATGLDAPDDGSAAQTDPDDTLTEFQGQLYAVQSCAEPGRVRLLLAAESVGALIAAEMQFAGLPWRSAIHDRLLTAELGPRVAPGQRPEQLELLATRIRTALGDETVNPDSPPELLRALNRAGVAVATTRAWELERLEHPVIEPLLRYKKLARLLSNNGWFWMESWIVRDRFHPEYLPGGVVTGRWATRGGGALQLPRQVRGAVVADEGWTFVVADAAQLEPRILAALSRDTDMAAAGRGTDLYAGIVASGVVETRAHAKVAMLGAMYGATSGESGRLLPRLARAYPRALALTEAAARTGERGDVVSTRLGRSSPRPGAAWQDDQGRASEAGATAGDERRARSQARDWGRFTRNFIVQGSAAEWALCWMAEIRKGLWELPAAADADGERGESRSNPFAAAPHLVFFLHDEVIVHTPAALADQVAAVVTAAAATAGRLLFGDFPVDFPLTCVIVDSYADAK